MSFPEERHPLLRFISKDPAYFSFNVHGCRQEDFPPFLIDKMIFSNERTWSLYQRKDKNLLWLDSGSSEEPSERVVILDNAFKKGDIFYKAPGWEEDKNCVSDPLSYPFDQIFMINLLSRKIGFLVHSCGIDFQGEGLLFVGSSGAGKSTMANLWGENDATKILSDDRIVIRNVDGVFRIYGTPWMGTARFAKPDSAQLKKVFFLKQGSENKVTPISAAEAASRLLRASFAPFWDKAGMDFTLDLCSELFRRIQPYELAFLPDVGILDIIKEKR